MSPAPATVPCQASPRDSICATSATTRLTLACSQYRTGKTLGSGTYAIVKEAVHIKTGEYYACKVINKKLMEGREYMVRTYPSSPTVRKIAMGRQHRMAGHFRIALTDGDSLFAMSRYEMRSPS